MTQFADALNRLWPNGDQKIPGLKAGIIATAPAVFQKYGINSPLLIAHVMAQISHECGAGHDVVENLNYTAGRMMQVWPARFPTMDSAAPYAGNPKALANKVYNGRMGNAPGSDDGWNYRGRGASQTTGHEGYALLAKATGLDVLNHPDLVNDPMHFMECGVSDFIVCGCLPYAKADDVENVTRKLNGGYVGLSERRVWLSRWKAAVNAMPPLVILPSTPHPLQHDVPKVKPVSVPKPLAGKKTTGAVVAGGGAVVAAHQAGFGIATIACVAIVAAAIAFLIWKFTRK